MELNSKDLFRVREALLATEGEGLVRYMAQLHFGGAVEYTSTGTSDVARQLGWVDANQPSHMTETGWFAADSCREYVFWRERNRELPFADEAPDLLSAEALAGKSVLEVGCGSGMNLMSLSKFTADITGVEPIGIYRQIGSILAEREGIAEICMEPGHAENLPFEDSKFDMVLCITAHQYFDILPALREIARVLVPSGELVVIGGTLGAYLRHARESLKHSLTSNQVRSTLRMTRSHLVTVVNTLGYMAFRRRPLARRSKWSTAYPIYPTEMAMCQLITEAGLEINGPLRAIGPETCFRARKHP